MVDTKLKLAESLGATDLVNAKDVDAVGTVVDYEFRPDFAFCRPCYDRYKGHHDELDPKAVAEQRVPPIVSRPT